MSADGECVPIFLDTKEVEFPSGKSFTIVKPYTNYRSCHDGTPFEARMVFLCRSAADNEDYVMKVKVQLPAQGQLAAEGPSTTTAAEVEALCKFRDASIPYAPHLVEFKKIVQGNGFPFPGGYVTYTIMTKMPGISLFGKFWNMTNAERDEIVPATVEALKAIYALGVEPVDRGMRNVIWDAATKHCSIIDFELWDPVSEIFKDDKAEMQRWGLVRRPPPREWFMEWNHHHR